MAVNKFANLLHRNTNRITLILVYAVLEWILIVLLLLNSLFSHLIIKFADFFGLKPPCLWCAKGSHENICGDLVCEVHAKEISKLGYCSNHQKLVGSRDMCGECLSSRPELQGSSEKCLLKCVKDFGMVQNGEVSSLNCSCCGVSLSGNMYSSYILLKTSSLDVFENLITKAGDYDDSVSEKEYGPDKVIDFSAELHEGEKVLENKNENHIFAEIDESYLEVTENEIKENGYSLSIPVSETDEFDAGKIDLILEMEEKKEESFVMDLEFFLDYTGHRLVPFELMDSITEEHESTNNAEIEDEDKLRDRELSLDSVVSVKEKGALVVELDALIDIKQEMELLVLDSMEIEEDGTSLVFPAKDGHLAVEDFEKFQVFPVTDFPCNIGNDGQDLTGAAVENHSDVHTACEAAALVANSENEADVSIGTEIPDLELVDEQRNQESVHSHEDPWTSSADVYEADDHCPNEEFQSSLSAQQSFHLELTDEIEEDKVTDTPTFVDSLHQRLLLEKTDSYRTESVTSELEGGDGVVTVERLKSALRAERKALQVMYAELEEERSASAVAANQTMAMINRLQEEKAAMQMEALQYQRMMEEQSEYDQEALQLLNQLMVKREKEKQELEKELELYRKKLLEYETREKMRVALKRSKDESAFSSASKSDGLSIVLNQEAKEQEEGFYSHQECTPVDAVFNLGESFSDFEGERLSILEQLKVLEEKLMRTEDVKEQHFQDVRPIEEFCGENGNHVDENSHYANGHANGFSKRIGGQKGKSLLPLFDAMIDENGDIMLNGDGVDSLGESLFEMENKKLAVVEEVDHLYERLQALEADREFLKHCICSLKKGDKGMDLLQEILQHLRDLRNVELHVRNISDVAPM